MADDTASDTTSKLRHDIDKGKAGDKIGFPDPAAAPLGTDAEAGGASPTRDEVRTAQRHEVENRPDGPKAATEPRPVSAPEPSVGNGGRRIFMWLVVALLVLAGLAIAFAVTS